MLISSIPSPAQGVWQFGPVPVRAYAIAIVIGIVLAVWWGRRRWVARGGVATDIEELAVYAVPAGIVGGRLYHVITDWQIYFGPDGRGFLAALRIWEGGLGIWGAIALGFAGAAWYARRKSWPIGDLADALAPGIVLAQAVGRLGNWFNQELFGAPTSLPWGLEIDLAHRPSGYESFTTFHPTFLYELLWNLLVVAALLLAERRWRLAHGQLFSLYVVLYCVGRVWVESLRIDTANHILGLRLNVFTSILVGAGAGLWLWRSRRRHVESAEA